MQRPQVNIVHFSKTRVAALEHRGDPRLVGESVRKFIAWRRLNHLPPQHSATFNILYGDPQPVAVRDYRLDICAATDADIAANAYGVVGKEIPAGRCAVLRHIGAEDMLVQTIRYLYAEWLPSSGEALRDFPLFLQRVKFFPEVPENEAVIDVFLPLTDRDG